MDHQKFVDLLESNGLEKEILSAVFLTKAKVILACPNHSPWLFNAEKFLDPSCVQIVKIKSKKFMDPIEVLLDQLEKLSPGKTLKSRTEDIAHRFEFLVSFNSDLDLNFMCEINGADDEQVILKPIIYKALMSCERTSLSANKLGIELGHLFTPEHVSHIDQAHRQKLIIKNVFEFFDSKNKIQPVPTNFVLKNFEEKFEAGTKLGFGLDSFLEHNIHEFDSTERAVLEWLAPALRLISDHTLPFKELVQFQNELKGNCKELKVWLSLVWFGVHHGTPNHMIMEKIDPKAEGLLNTLKQLRLKNPTDPDWKLILDAYYVDLKDEKIKQSVLNFFKEQV